MTALHTSKRRTPRLDPMGLVSTRLAAGTPHVVLKDLGLEGFAVESPCPFIIGSRHEFMFTTHSGRMVGMTGEAVMLQRLDTPRSQYLAGFKFVPTGPETARSIEALIDAVTSPLTFL